LKRSWAVLWQSLGGLGARLGLSWPLWWRLGHSWVRRGDTGTAPGVPQGACHRRGGAKPCAQALKTLPVYILEREREIYIYICIYLFFGRDAQYYLARSVPWKAKAERFARRVHPVLLYGAGTWVWKQTIVQRIKAWETKLLMRMFRVAKQAGEEWVKWYKRSARVAIKMFAECGQQSVVEKLLLKIHRLAGVIGRAYAFEKEGLRIPPAMLFLESAISWRDTWWWRTLQQTAPSTDPSWRHPCGPGRTPLQWEEPLVAAIGVDWREKACKPDWGATYETVAQTAFAAVSLKRPKPAQSANEDQQIPYKEPRVVFEEAYPWSKLATMESLPAVELLADSLVVVNWANGIWEAEARQHKAALQYLVSSLHRWWGDGVARPRTTTANWARHIYRELNKRADSLATSGLQGNPMSWATARQGIPVAIRAWSDGGLRNDSAGAGWIIKGAWTWEDVEKDHWEDLACAALELGCCDALIAEIVAFTQVVDAVDSILRTGRVKFSDSHRVRVRSTLAASEANLRCTADSR